MHESKNRYRLLIQHTLPFPLHSSINGENITIDGGMTQNADKLSLVAFASVNRTGRLSENFLPPAIVDSIEA